MVIGNKRNITDMKRVAAIMIMAVSLVFSGCNTEEEVYASLLDKEKASMGTPLELSANDVLVNGDLWNYVRTIRYTEPDGGGEEQMGFDLSDPLRFPDGALDEFMYAFDGEYMYVYNDRYKHLGPSVDTSKLKYVYNKFRYTISADGSIEVEPATAESRPEYSYKILGYGTNKVLLERSRLYDSGTYEYKYEVLVLEMASDSNKAIRDEAVEIDTYKDLYQ